MEENLSGIFLSPSPPKGQERRLTVMIVILVDALCVRDVFEAEASVGVFAITLFLIEEKKHRFVATAKRLFTPRGVCWSRDLVRSQ